MVDDASSASNVSLASSSAPSETSVRPRVYRPTASASAASRVTLAAVIGWCDGGTQSADACKGQPMARVCDQCKATLLAWLLCDVPRASACARMNASTPGRWMQPPSDLLQPKVPAPCTCNISIVAYCMRFGIFFWNCCAPLSRGQKQGGGANAPSDGAAEGSLMPLNCSIVTEPAQPTGNTCRR